VFLEFDFTNKFVLPVSYQPFFCLLPPKIGSLHRPSPKAPSTQKQFPKTPPKVSPPTKKAKHILNKIISKKEPGQNYDPKNPTYPPTYPQKRQKSTMARRLARGLSLALLCSVAFVRPGPVRPERTARAASAGLWQEALTAERGRAELLLSKLQERNKLSSTIRQSKRRDLIGLLWDLIGFN
jgi:hypothetical protein